MHFFTRIIPSYCKLLALGVLAGLSCQGIQAQAIRGTKRGEAYGYNSAADLRTLAPGVA